MNRKNVSLLILIGSAVLCFLFAFVNRWYLFELPYTDTLAFNYPSYAMSDVEDNSYIIDTSLRRILKLTPTGQLDFAIRGGQRTEGTFFYAADLAVDRNGNLYVLNLLHDAGGFFVEKEEVLKYSPHGKYLETVFSQSYDKRASTRVQRGQLNTLKLIDSEITWFDIAADSVAFYSYNTETGKTGKQGVVEYPEANILLSDCSWISNKRWAAVSKKGELLVLDPVDSSSETVYKAEGTPGDALSVPWNVDTDSAGLMYYTDLGTNSIRRSDMTGSGVFSDESLKQAGFDTEGATYYRLDINSKNIITTFDDYGIIRTDLNGKVLSYTDSIKIPIVTLLIKGITLLAALAGIILLVLVIRHIYVHFLNRKIPQVLINIFSILFVIALTTLLVVTVVLKNFSTRYTKSLLEKTQQMAQLIPSGIDGDLFNDIKSQQDYMGPEFRKIRSRLHSALNDNNDPWNDRYYFALYRVYDEQLYGMMYLNDGITLYHPFYYFDDPQGAYRLAYDGQIAAETDADNWGTWIYAVGPVFDSSGKVVALLEVGTDLYSFTVENRKLFRNLILDVGTLVVIFVLMLIEFVFFLDLMRKQKTLHSVDAPLKKQYRAKGAKIPEKYMKQADDSLKYIVSLTFDTEKQEALGIIRELHHVIVLKSIYNEDRKQTSVVCMIPDPKPEISAHLVSSKVLYEPSSTPEKKIQRSFAEGFLVRPVNFLITAAISMSVAFVPVMMRELYQPLWGLTEDVVIALPISLEMLFFALGLIIGGVVAHKGGWKGLQLSGIGFAVVGLLLSAISRDMYFFFAARSIVGLGSGLVLIGLRAVISAEKDAEMKSSAYSHFYAGAMAGLNVGVFFGAFLADQIGFYDVFYVAAGIAVLAGVFMMQLLFKINTELPEQKTGSYSVMRFVFEPKVLLFFLLAIIPSYTAGMFLMYYFPLFASSQGISVSDIGRFFILNGLFVIYLGPPLSQFFKRYLGDRKSLLLGSLGWAISLGVFAVTGSIWGAVITVILMGITEGFCVSAQNDYYLNIDVVQNMGEERAVAYFEVAAKIAEVAAPILFGLVLAIGPMKGIGLFAAIVTVLTIIYIPLSVLKREKKGGEKA